MDHRTQGSERGFADCSVIVSGALVPSPERGWDNWSHPRTPAPTPAGARAREHPLCEAQEGKLLLTLSLLQARTICPG